MNPIASTCQVSWVCSFLFCKFVITTVYALGCGHDSFTASCCHCCFSGGGKSNQQSEVGGTIIEQDGTESTIGIQQPVPSNVDGLETMFNVERENAIGRAHQSEINTQEKGVPKSKSRKKSDLKKETRGRRVIEQSELENVVVGTQQSNQSASFNFPRHEASSSRTKRGAPKIDRDIFERIGREICKKAIFANSKTGAAGSSRKQ